MITGLSIEEKVDLLKNLKLDLEEDEHTDWESGCVEDYNLKFVLVKE